MSLDQYEIVGVAIGALLLLNVFVQITIIRVVWLRIGSLRRDLNRTLHVDLDKLVRKVIYDHAKWQEQTESLRLEMEEARKKQHEKYDYFLDQKAPNSKRGNSEEIPDVRPEYEYLSAHRLWLCLKEEAIEAEIDFLDLPPINIDADTPLGDPRRLLDEIINARVEVEKRQRELRRVPPLPEEL